MRLDFIDFDSAEVKKDQSPVPQAINTNIDIADARLEGENLELKFAFTTAYAPGNSFMRLTGNARLSGKDTAAAYNEWSKTRRISGVAGEQIINMINYTCSINAVFIARVFNLTPPIVPPNIKFAQASVSKGKKQ